MQELKRPRHYAIECIQIDSKEGRIKYLDEDVPRHLQDWVKTYVVIWWPRRREICERIRRQRDQASRIPGSLRS